MGHRDLTKKDGKIVHLITYKHTPKQIRSLPNTAGSYYLIDRRGRKIFSGKTNKIRIEIEKFHKNKEKKFKYISIIPQKFKANELIKSKVYRSYYNGLIKIGKQSLNFNLKNPISSKMINIPQTIKYKEDNQQFLNKLFNDYEKESRFLQKLDKTEILLIKKKFYELLKSEGISKEKTKDIIDQFKKIPISPNLPLISRDFNLLDVILREGEWVIKPDIINYFIEKSKKLDSDGLTVDIYFENDKIIFVEPKINSKYSTSENVGKYLGYSL